MSRHDDAAHRPREETTGCSPPVAFSTQVAPAHYQTQLPKGRDEHEPNKHKRVIVVDICRDGEFIRILTTKDSREASDGAGTTGSLWAVHCSGTLPGSSRRHTWHKSIYQHMQRPKASQWRANLGKPRKKEHRDAHIALYSDSWVVFEE